MYNRYTIELIEEKVQVGGSEVKAKIYLNNEFCLGTIWNPANTLKSKEDFHKLFESIGNAIYGQEKKASEREKSDSKILESLAAKSKAKQEDLPEK